MDIGSDVQTQCGMRKARRAACTKPLLDQTHCSRFLRRGERERERERGGGGEEKRREAGVGRERQRERRREAEREREAKGEREREALDNYICLAVAVT